MLGTENSLSFLIWSEVFAACLRTVQQWMKKPRNLISWRTQLVLLLASTFIGKWVCFVVHGIPRRKKMLLVFCDVFLETPRRKILIEPILNLQWIEAGRLQKQIQKVYDLAPKTFHDCLLFSLKGMDEKVKKKKVLILKIRHVKVFFLFFCRQPGIWNSRKDLNFCFINCFWCWDIFQRRDAKLRAIAVKVSIVL